MSAAQPEHADTTALLAEVAALRSENARLAARLRAIDEQSDATARSSASTSPSPSSSSSLSSRTQSLPGAATMPSPSFVSTAPSLSAADIHRYGRQMILPSVGARAQARICASSVLIVGAGGLGSPCALYLAAAGVGRIGIVDSDSVELGNLHRQILHTERGAAACTPKAHSARDALHALNSCVRVDAHCCAFTAANACALVDAYDLVIDCTDNAVTRYTINDAAVVCGRALVSGAAIGVEGQLTVYAYRGAVRSVVDDADTPEPLSATIAPTVVGPCYRCLFPQPPPPAAVQSCGNAGVLGPVPGVIGVLQALEALKLLGRFGEPLVQRLLLFDALGAQMRTVRLRGPVATCVACSPSATLTRASIASFAYSEFCGNAPAHDRHVTPAVGTSAATAAASTTSIQTLSARDYAALRASQRAHILIDVRDEAQFGMCALPGARSAPLSTLRAAWPALAASEGLAAVDPAVQPDQDLDAPDQTATMAAAAAAAAAAATAAPPSSASPTLPVSPLIVLVCRRGIASLQAARLLVDECGVPAARVAHVHGGLVAWHEQVDAHFPLY